MVIKCLMTNQVSEYKSGTINYIKNTQRFEQTLFQTSEGNPFFQLAANVLVYF